MSYFDILRLVLLVASFAVSVGFSSSILVWRSICGTPAVTMSPILAWTASRPDGIEPSSSSESEGDNLDDSTAEEGDIWSSLPARVNPALVRDSLRKPNTVQVSIEPSSVNDEIGKVSSDLLYAVAEYRSRQVDAPRDAFGLTELMNCVFDGHFISILHAQLEKGMRSVRARRGEATDKMRDVLPPTLDDVRALLVLKLYLWGRFRGSTRQFFGEMRNTTELQLVSGGAPTGSSM